MNQKVVSILVASALIATPALAATYEIDGAHSSAVYRIKHLDTSYFYGTFNEFGGTIDYDAGKIGASSIEVSINAESVNSRNGQRDGHIKSPDFLNVKQFPKISFKSKSVAAKGDGMELKGDLTMLGVTREITVAVEKTGEGKNPRSGSEIIGFEARFTVKRSEFDMKFMVGPLSDEIDFILAVEAVKQ